MRIAIVAEVFLPKIDGVVGRTLNLIRHLVAAGDEVLIVCPQAEGCTLCDVPVLPVPSFSFPPYPEYRVGIPDRSLAAKLKEFKPDVIHYLNPFAFGFRCYDVLRGVGLPTPTVFSFHTAYGEFAKRYRGLKTLSALVWWLTREYHNHADLNLTVSAAMREDLIRRGFERVELWPPAVDSDLYHPSRRSDAMRDRLTGGRPERKLLLTVSRLAPEKNVSFLAGVLRRAAGCLPGHRRRRAGSGRAGTRFRRHGRPLHRLSQRRGVGSRLRFRRRLRLRFRNRDDGQRRPRSDGVRLARGRAGRPRHSELVHEWRKWIPLSAARFAGSGTLDAGLVNRRCLAPPRSAPPPGNRSKSATGFTPSAGCARSTPRPFAPVAAPCAGTSATASSRPPPSASCRHSARCPAIAKAPNGSRTCALPSRRRRWREITSLA